MNVILVACGDPSHSVLASSSVVRPRCSGSSMTHGRQSALPNSVHVRPASWIPQRQALFLVFLVTLVAFPATVSAAPSLGLTDRLGVHVGAIDGIRPRGQNDTNSQSNSSSSQSNSNGSITMGIWLPILLVTLVFILFSFCACFRRCAGRDASATTANGAGSTAANGNAANQVRSRRRRRTPSQMSTKSLPPYMKEPGDQELVLFRGPLEAEDDQAPPHGMVTLAESDEEGEHPNATFDVPLDRIESMETMVDSSTTNLIGRASASLPRPPELHDHRRSADAHSLDSIGSEAELLAVHQRAISVDNHAGPIGQAPAYTEAVSEMTTISLNDPHTNDGSSNAIIAPPSSVADPAAGRGHSRFSFLLHNPFSSHNDASGASSNVTPPLASIRSESPAPYNRSESALSRFSSRESHESHYSRAPSRTNNFSHVHTRSSSNLYRVFRSHSPVPAGSSTISLDNISAPLTHTLTHAGFNIPKGGLTPEQIKLITSREALERFGVPYGPDAVAAFELSRERLAEMGPPPDFESVTGENQDMAGGEGSAAEAVVETTAQRSADTVALDLDTALSGSTLLSPYSALSQDVRAESRASTAVSYATAPETDEDRDQDGRPEEAQTVQVYTSGDESEADADPRTARPMTPITARPLSLAGDRGSVVKRS